jgi:DNA-binding transcriptional LysR family regulator
LNIRALETFYWVARLGGFTAAAVRLGSTQSTVSMRIQELERDIGVALFDRSRRAARLTAKGQELVAHAEEMLRLSSLMRERMAGPENIPGTLRLGVAEVVSITWLPRLVKDIHENWPKIRLELDEALTQDLVERLRQGSLDLVLAPGRVADAKFVGVSLGRIEFAWMASPALGLPERTLRPRDLQDWPIIALARESYHHSSIEKWFHSAHAVFHRLYTCKSLGVAASLAAAGLGLTLLPERCYRSEIASGRLRTIPTVPRLAPVEFMAIHATASVAPVVRDITRLASQISDFVR